MKLSDSQLGYFLVFLFFCAGTVFGASVERIVVFSLGLVR